MEVMPIDICSIGLPVILRKSSGDIFIYSVTVRISTENDMNFNAVMKLYMWSIFFLWSAGPSQGFQIKLGQELDFYVKNRLNLSQLFFIKEYKKEVQLLLCSYFDNFDF